LGELSPTGRFFTSGSFLKNIDFEQMFWLLFPRYMLCTLFDEEWDWAKSWTMLLKTGPGGVA
jgi:hypothetical protein